jgi:hypothetical protein
MKRIVLLFISILLFSCTDKEKIQKEIYALENTNLLLMKIQSDIFRDNLTLIDVITSLKNKAENGNIIRITNQIVNNRKRVKELQKELDSNRDKRIELQKQLE